VTARYRVVSSTAVEVRISGVLQNAYYGEVVELDDGAATQRLVEAGAVVPVPEGVPT
jgi:hypothetical protein